MVPHLIIMSWQSPKAPWHCIWCFCLPCFRSWGGEKCPCCYLLCGHGTQKYGEQANNNNKQPIGECVCTMYVPIVLLVLDMLRLVISASVVIHCVGNETQKGGKQVEKNDRWPFGVYMRWCMYFPRSPFRKATSPSGIKSSSLSFDVIARPQTGLPQ